MRGLTRRTFLEGCGIAALSWGVKDLLWGEAAASPSRAVWEDWVGEQLAYDVDCRLMPSIARGELSLFRVPGEGRCLAFMDARLTGIAGVLSLRRREQFVSLLAWSPSQKRFMPEWYMEQVSRTGSWKRKVLVFRQGSGQYQEYSIRPHRVRRRRRMTGKRVLDDPLSAFYNWRLGAFGPLRPGASYRIDTLARKDGFVLRFRVADKDEAQRHLGAVPRVRLGAYWVRASLDREIISAVRGDVDAWLDSLWIPVYGRATQVKWLGEVEARLVRRGRLQDPLWRGSTSPPLTKELWDAEAGLTERSSRVRA